MKIIALLTDRYHDTTGAVIEVTSPELFRILGTTQSSVNKLFPGCQAEINMRYDHAQDVLAAAADAKKLPSALRAFADTLETLHPAINDITDPVIDASFEVTK